ncbi:MAG TPA: DUF1800 domain-containing protein [Vicinamibacteria bacterium]|nr:DUF1800 domain-containing protein [Vicinamibacteria bacterium]
MKRKIGHHSLTRRGAASLILSLTLVSPAGLGAAPADEATVVHVLNRLGYGPRPRDLETIRVVGVKKWIEEQLRPEGVPDRAMAARLAPLKTIGLSTKELLKGYEIPPEARQAAAKARAELEKSSEEEQKQARRDLLKKYAPSMEGSPRQVLDELQEAKVLRALYSERQLDEVLVDFWMNHFNVFAQKGPERFLVGEYERDVIRPRAWGRFEDLLLATAESPAMLFYLDNWLSADPNAPPPGRARGPYFRPGRFGGPPPRGTEAQGPRPKRGLNENYAREIMELHTLGVDGGYTQKDVTEVARCFTGWTIRGLRQQNPEFIFDDRIHDHGDKVVLGQRIEGGGQEEARRVIHILATHPSTATFISTKLCRRFVADDPPAALVDRAAATFRRTEGNIREVVRTIVTSPEFLAQEARAAKVKTPLEFVVSAARVAGAQVEDASALARRIAAMGMPLYMQAPPTGYKDTAEAWVSTSGLVARLNFALDLAGGRIRGVTVDAVGLASGGPEGQSLADSMAARLVPAGLSESTRKAVEGEAGLGLDPARVAGLVLGSPEFQRR